MKTLQRKQAGATMIEILITVIVIAVGLLGLASLQAVSLRQTVNSQMGVQAQLLVQDLAEMIIAFDVEAEGAYEFAAVPAAMGTNCVTSACTKAQMAQYNVWSWAQNMSPVLPSYALSIGFDEPNRAYEIALSWNADRVDPYVASTCTAADGLNPGCFAMLVEL